MPVLPKLFATVLYNRLDDAATHLSLRAPTQAGFRKDARLEDNILALMTAIEHAHATNHQLYVLFIDLEKAYDTIDRGLLWRIMLDELGLNPSLVGSL